MRIQLSSPRLSGGEPNPEALVLHLATGDSAPLNTIRDRAAQSAAFKPPATQYSASSSRATTSSSTPRALSHKAAESTTTTVAKVRPTVSGRRRSNSCNRFIAERYVGRTSSGCLGSPPHHEGSKDSPVHIPAFHSTTSISRSVFAHALLLCHGTSTAQVYKTAAVNFGKSLPGAAHGACPVPARQ